MRSSSAQSSMIPATLISTKIHLIRATRVMFDADLAALYGVSTANLNKAVRRNHDRFPEDFMFQLKAKEAAILIFQSGISRSKQRGWGGRRGEPYAFTEQGVAMLSSVLRSDRAVRVNIAIMRAFVQLRRALATHEELRKNGTARRFQIRSRVHRDQANPGTSGKVQTTHRLSCSSTRSQNSEQI